MNEEEIKKIYKYFELSKILETLEKEIENKIKDLEEGNSNE